ncbi:MAG: DUF6118 family protein [Novosphingobium sp.]
MMETSLPTLAPQDQPPNINPAEAAFAELSAKVELLETLLRGLAARRDAAPDYSETLGEIADLLEKMRNAINTLARRPAMEITPDAMAEQIAAAGANARAEDSAVITRARDRIDKAAARMEQLAGTAATIRDQRRHLLWTAGGSALAGMLLMTFLPGAILRALPQGWHMPETMAAHIIGEPTFWEAGTRLMRADSPRAWDALTQAADMLHDNRQAIEKCQRSATKAKKPARCVIKVAPDS